NVEALAAHVLFAHVDDTLEAEERAYGRSGDAVLSRTGLRDDALLSHAPCEQRLTETVVDLVRAGMQQIFALEPDARSGERRAQVFGAVERGGTTRVIVQQAGELVLDPSVGTRFEIGVLQLLDRRHQNFGDVLAAVRPEVSAWIRLRGQAGHASSAARAAFKYSRILLCSLIPGDDSRREQASTPQGCATAIARPTFSASSPPARMIRNPVAAATDQSTGTPAPPYNSPAGPSSSSASAGAPAY